MLSQVGRGKKTTENNAKLLQRHNQRKGKELYFVLKLKKKNIAYLYASIVYSLLFIMLDQK